MSLDGKAEELIGLKIVVRSEATRDGERCLERITLSGCNQNSTIRELVNKARQQALSHCHQNDRDFLNCTVEIGPIGVERGKPSCLPRNPLEHATIVSFKHYRKGGKKRRGN